MSNLKTKGISLLVILALGFLGYGFKDSLKASFGGTTSFTAPGLVKGGAHDTWMHFAGAADVNGDGQEDIVVCNDYASMNIFTSDITSSSYVDSTDGEIIITGATSEDFATECAVVGDVNADGYDDLLIGAPGFDPDSMGATADGAAYLIFGSSSLESESPALIDDLVDRGEALQFIGNDSEGQMLGSKVRSAGDVNGDGYDDFLLSALREASNTGTGEVGAVYLLYGCSTIETFCGEMTALVPASIEIGNSTIAHFAGTVAGTPGGGGVGESISELGDVNGDGYDDFVIGSRTVDEIYLIEGSSTKYEEEELSTGTVGYLFSPYTTNDLNYPILNFAGDVNGDGYNDIFIGSTGCEVGGYTNNQCVFLVLGSSTIGDMTISTSTALQFYRNGNALALNTASGVGDVTGDGYDDFVFGHYKYSDTTSYQGAAYLSLGRSGLAVGSYNLDTYYRVKYVLAAPSASDQLGGFVKGAGDYNGDGYDDFFVNGAAIETDLPDASSYNQGATWLVFGQKKFGIWITKVTKTLNL